VRIRLEKVVVSDVEVDVDVPVVEVVSDVNVVTRLTSILLKPIDFGQFAWRGSERGSDGVPESGDSGKTPTVVEVVSEVVSDPEVVVEVVVKRSGSISSLNDIRGRSGLALGAFLPTAIIRVGKDLADDLAHAFNNIHRTFATGEASDPRVPGTGDSSEEAGKAALPVVLNVCLEVKVAGGIHELARSTLLRIAEWLKQVEARTVTVLGSRSRNARSDRSNKHQGTESRPSETGDSVAKAKSRDVASEAGEGLQTTVLLTIEVVGSKSLPNLEFLKCE
jgi:hypothetical protein